MGHPAHSAFACSSSAGESANHKSGSSIRHGSSRCTGVPVADPTSTNPVVVVCVRTSFSSISLHRFIRTGIRILDANSAEAWSEDLLTNKGHGPLVRVRGRWRVWECAYRTVVRLLPWDTDASTARRRRIARGARATSPAVAAAAGRGRAWAEATTADTVCAAFQFFIVSTSLSRSIRSCVRTTAPRSPRASGTRVGERHGGAQPIFDPRFHRARAPRARGRARPHRTARASWHRCPVSQPAPDRPAGVARRWR